MSTNYTYYWIGDIKSAKQHVRSHPEDAQRLLEGEYKHPHPRYTLCHWLKRHRLHNPTTRVIPAGGTK